MDTRTNRQTGIEGRRRSSLSSHCSGGKRREEKLKREGWTRRFTTDEPRLSEAVELYKLLGYEVLLEPASFDEASEVCKTCLLADCSKYKTIYTRKLVTDKKSWHGLR